MKNLFIISTYTILQTIKKKSFIISNIIVAVFVLLIFVILSQYLEGVSDKMNKIEEIEDIPVILIDNTKTFGKYIYEENTKPYLFILISEETVSEMNKEANKMSENEKEANKTVKDLVEEESSQSISFDEIVKKIKTSIQEGDITYAINIEEDNQNVDKPFALKFLCNKESDVNETEALLITNMLKSIYKDNNLMSSGIDISGLDFELKYSVKELSNNKKFEGGDIIAMAVSVLLFLAIYLYGHSIASSISSEKTSRIIETLVTSTKPRLIVLGKTIGMGILGLVQLLFLILVAAFAYKTLIPSQMDVVSQFLSTVNISTFSIILLFIFFILGYLLYAFSFAVVGAIISKAEDTQIANMPLSLVSLFSFYLSFFTINMPQTSLSKFASYFPFSSTFAVPAKMLAGYISMEEVYVAIIILIVSVIFVAFCAIRIYSNVILNYGNKVKFKDLFNLFLNIK